MLHLRTFRNRVAGLPDLLQFGALCASGIVKLKSGALLGGFYYRGRDLASSTSAERNFVTNRVNAALARLGAGWVTWQDAIRMPAPSYPAESESHFPDPVSALLDAERREAFETSGAHFESEYALLFQYMPPATTTRRTKNFVFVDSVKQDVVEDQQGRIIEQFEQSLREVQDILGDVIRFKRMQSFYVELPGGKKVMRDDVVTYLQFCVTGIMQPVNVPAVPAYLDTYIGAQDLYSGVTPKIGENYVAVVAIEGFPTETWPNMVNALDNLSFPYRWSTRMIYLEQREALSQLNKFRRKWKQKERGFFSQVFKTASGVVNEDAVMMRRAAEEAITDANSGLVAFGFYTPVVVMHGKDRVELEQRAQLVQREIRRIGFTGRVESVNTMDAWLGSIPGHPHANVRRPVIHTLNLADLVPLASVWPGESRHPSPFYPKNSPPLAQVSTAGSTPFRVNLHVGDLGHTMIVGPTGAGKSTLLGFVISQHFRYPTATVAAFDKGRSLLPLTFALGGTHHDIGSEGDRTAFCPLQFLGSPADAAWAEDWIAGLYELQANAQPTPRQKEAIHRAIELMQQPGQERSLSHFKMTVQDEDVRSAINYYTLDGSMGHLLDAEKDGLDTSTFTTFELDELMSMGESNVIPVLLYLFRRIEKSLTGQPALLVLDEAWVMLGHPVFVKKLREWLKTLRRSNCAVVLATQSLSDAAKSGIFDVLVESCPTKILLPNEEADKRGVEGFPGPFELYTSMGLNETEISLLKNATRKRDYYFMSTEGRRMFDMELGPIARSFLGVSSKEEIARVREFVAEHGEAWPFAWLEARGVAYERFLTQEKANAKAA